MGISIQKNKIEDSVLSTEFQDVLNNVYTTVDILKSKQSESINFQYAIYSIVVIKDLIPVGRILVYKNPFHVIDAKDVISFGYLEAISDMTIWESLITELQLIAKEYNISSIIGPMNGSTWEQYRLSEPTEKPLFLSEPFYPSYYCDNLRGNGFSNYSNYISNIDRTLDWRKDRLLKKEEELKSILTIRPIDLDNLEAELISLYPLVTSAFEENLLYSPIDLTRFVEKYIKLKPIITPEMVLIAEDNETREKAGFIFAFPDLLNKSEKGFIIKTLARNTNPKYAGIGSVLGNVVTKFANENDYTYCIHAFIINSNSSALISKSFTGELLKQHTLFIKQLVNE